MPEVSSCGVSRKNLRGKLLFSKMDKKQFQIAWLESSCGSKEESTNSKKIVLLEEE